MILNEELAHTRGFIQYLDPRVKLFSCVLFIVIVGLARSFWILAAIMVLITVIVCLSRISPGFFIKRVLLFLPFTAIVTLPALFITPGEPWWHIGSRVIITLQGVQTTGFLLLRVMESISLGIIIILTTPWNGVLAGLRWFRLPTIIIDILGMTYRYIFLLLHTANSMFFARRSRALGTFSGAENRRWLAHNLGCTMVKSQYLSEEIYLAMIARGYHGEIYTINRLQFRNRDYFSTGITILIAFVLIWSIYR